MRKLIIMAAIAFSAACNVDVNEKDDRDTVRNEIDTFIDKADTTLEKWGDSAEARYKDIKREVKDRLDDDNRDRRDTIRR